MLSQSEVEGACAPVQSVCESVCANQTEVFLEGVGQRGAAGAEGPSLGSGELRVGPPLATPPKLALMTSSASHSLILA